MSSEPYLLYVAFAAWALPAVAFYLMGRAARQSWGAPRGFWSEAFLVTVCALWPAVAAVGLAAVGLLAGLVLFVLTNSIEFKSQR